ncbi:MAG: serine/threonine-protein kinase, partial [Actinomycetota bacterium]
ALARDPEIAARFEREGRAAASLDHPNVVPVHEAGEDDGLVYLAMRLVAGETLDDLLLAGGPIGVDRTADHLGPVADALDHAHGRGLIHRDVKPSNIFIDGDRVWLGDFGIAATADQVGRYTTGTLGTAHYMAPEQASKGELDGRADVYALGCVAHRCLTGRPPYDRGELVATLVAHVNEPVPQLGHDALDRFLALALAKDPDERFQTATELVDALRAVGPVDVAALTAASSPGRSGTATGPTGTGVGAAAPATRARPGPVVPAPADQPPPTDPPPPAGPPSEAVSASGIRVGAEDDPTIPPVPRTAAADNDQLVPPAPAPASGAPLPPPAPVPATPSGGRRRRWPVVVGVVAAAAVVVGAFLLLTGGDGDGGGGAGDVAVVETVDVGGEPLAVAVADQSV